MSFTQLSHEARFSKDDAPSKKKQFFQVNDSLRSYLKHHAREVKLPVQYSDLFRITYSVPLKDKNGNDTMWE
jgi:hypothetical protein